MATAPRLHMTDYADLADTIVTCASCRRETRFEQARGDLSAWRASPIGDSYCVACLQGVRIECGACRREVTVDRARWEAWRFAPREGEAFCADCAGALARNDLVSYCGSCGWADPPGSQCYPNVCDSCSNWGIW
jgi:hypothetical protein